MEYRRLTRELDDETAALVDHVQTQFKEAHIPVETIETEDRGKIAIIFERVNRAGVPLDTYQLLSAWTWSEDFDLRNRFEELGADLEEFSFGDIREEQNLLLRCCGAVVRNNASSHTIVSLNGAEVREKFDEITKGIYGAIEFLRRNCGVESLQIMPYAAMIVPLTRFYATESNAGFHPNELQIRSLKRWFWRSCFNRRYSSSVDTALAQDIKAMQKLRDNDAMSLDKPFVEVTPEFFLENQFSLNAVNTQTFVLLLASENPKSFLSGAPVDLQRVLQTCNKTEFHHIYPKAYLASSGITEKRDQFRLANFCFLSQTDNRSIKNKAPYIYVNDMPGNIRSDIFNAAFIPENGLNLDYHDFVQQRATLLAVKANELCNQ